MSHLKERKEKICLNCNADLHGRYCHVCGQENLEPKETVWHLVTHFFNDITHFDGKFFETVKHLLRRPGFLSYEYMRGKRATYLNPIRMYVFTSAIFFIVVFSLKGKGDMINSGGRETLAELREQKARQEKELESASGSTREDAERRLSKLNVQIAAISRVYGDSTTHKFDDEELEAAIVKTSTDSLLEPNLPAQARERIRSRVLTSKAQEEGWDFAGWSTAGYRTVEQYEADQAKLPEGMRDGWFKRMTMKKMIHLHAEYREDRHGFLEHLWENILHSFPKILFITLPLFALTLNILYFRHKKNYFYVDHGIFTIHVYCATFILLLLFILVQKIADTVHINWISVICYLLMTAIWIYILIYLYKAMRGFYKQGRVKSFIKYFLACSISFVVNIFLFILFVLISVVSLA